MSYNLIINHWKNMDCNDFIMYVHYNSQFYIYDIYEDKQDTFEELKDNFLKIYDNYTDWNPELDKKSYDIKEYTTDSIISLTYYTKELADSFIERCMLKKPYHKILYLLIKTK